MKNQRETLYLSVCATDKCNRGCKHCMVSATNNGTNFIKKYWVRKLMEEAKDLNYKVKGLITGLGEPLMHPEIAQVTKAFIGLKICASISVLTSGFLEKDINERQRFIQLTDLKRKCNLDFQLSFNLYSPTFSERIMQTSSLLFSQNVISMSDINIVCDRKNFYKTHHELYNVLSCVSVKNGMDIDPLTLDYSDPVFKQNFSAFLKQEFNEEEWIHLFGDALLVPCFYKVSGKNRVNKYFRTSVSMTTPLGYAKNLPAGCFNKDKNFTCNRILKAKGRDNELIMGPDGKIYAGCNCLLGNLPLGTWETPLKKLLLRKNLLQKHLLRLVLSDRYTRWSEWPCEECAALAKRNFCFD